MKTLSIFNQLKFGAKEGLIFIALLFAQNAAQAAIPRQQVVPSVEFVKMASEPPPSSDMYDKIVQQIIPTDINNRETQENVARKIADHSLQTFLQGDAFKNSDLGKTTSKLESVMKADISLGGGDSTPNADGTPGEPGIQHKIEVQYQAVQNIAKIEYEGFLKATASVSMNGGKSEVAIEEDLTDKSKLVLNHQTDSATSMVNYYLAW